MDSSCSYPLLTFITITFTGLLKEASIWNVTQRALQLKTKSNYSYGARIFRSWLNGERGHLSVELVLDFFRDLMSEDISYGVANYIRSWLSFMKRSCLGKTEIMGDQRVLLFLQGYEKISIELNWKHTTPLTWSMLEPKLKGGWSSTTAAMTMLGYAFLLHWSEVLDF